MFSASVAVVLHIALREAVSRRHAFLTLEHLLYVLSHDPDGERILTACGADLDKLRRDLSAYLETSVERVPRGSGDEPEQTAAFRQVLQTAILHVQAAQREEANAGDILAAIMQQPKTHAARLLADDVQENLKGAEIFALDTGALLAGTRFRGDFEERFKAVIRALAGRPKAILFIDEIHSTVGAGAVTGGTMDLATMMKPLLTAGELRVIGSTTFEEFKHIEKDRALARRLQKIAIDEPSIDETVRILAGLRGRYEAHHAVTYTDRALEAAAKLAARHLRDYRLPDSAIDLIDEAGAGERVENPRGGGGGVGGGGIRAGGGAPGGRPPP